MTTIHCQRCSNACVTGVFIVAGHDVCCETCVERALAAEVHECLDHARDNDYFAEVSEESLDVANDLLAYADDVYTLAGILTRSDKNAVLAACVAPHVATWQKKNLT